jgi:hypothetical protein
MNWKIIILGFIISLFSFIFITSGYSYKEGFNAKYMKMLKEKQMKQAKEKQMKQAKEKQNQLNQLNQMKQAKEKQMKQAKEKQIQLNQLNQMNQATRLYERKQINQIRSNDYDTKQMSRVKQKANLSINKAVSDNNNIINHLNRMSDLIYNTLNPNKRKQSPIIPSNYRPSVRPNLRSVRRPMPKRGNVVRSRARSRR